MSDAVLVAITAGFSNILAIVVGRLLSRNEHKKTAKTVNQIKEMLNGNHP